MQLRGTQKRMIAVKTAESNIFEEAYFVLRANIDKSSQDIIAEAESIINSYTQGKEKKDKGEAATVKTMMFSVGSFLFGVIMTALCMILL